MCFQAFERLCCNDHMCTMTNFEPFMSFLGWGGQLEPLPFCELRTVGPNVCKQTTMQVQTLQQIQRQTGHGRDSKESQIWGSQPRNLACMLSPCASPQAPNKVVVPGYHSPLCDFCLTWEKNLELIGKHSGSDMHGKIYPGLWKNMKRNLERG